jgi:hypothetical protein
MDNIDFLSKVFDRALDIVFVKYPARTGLGVIFGCTLSFFAHLFSPALSQIAFADFVGAPWWGWVPVGIVIMHVPTIASFFRQQPVGNESLDQAIDLIERASFSKEERRQQYRNLLERITSNIVLSQETQRQISALERVAAQEDDNQLVRKQ